MEKVKAPIVIAAVAMLYGCSEAPPPIRIVAAIGACTEATGGWGGAPGRCRVTFEDGGRGTVYRPVEVGDMVQGASFGVYLVTDTPRK